MSGDHVKRCGVTNHVGEWAGRNLADPAPCTHCGTPISGLDVYQYAWSSEGPMCFGLCRGCYTAIRDESGAPL